MSNFALCSNCFQDQGLKLDAQQFGLVESSTCPNCGSETGQKLSSDLIGHLAHRYFVRGSLHRCDYGAAPIIQFNDRQQTSIDTSPWFESDVRLIEKTLGVGFFYYAPRMWMVGEIEPLKALIEPETRASMIRRTLAEYPIITLKTEQVFYRIRKSPADPTDFSEYDSLPIVRAGAGRLDSKGFSVMYCSQDLQVCIHECRLTAEDELFLATLAATRDLRLLDLTEVLEEEGVTEFESLDIAIHMLFLAGDYSYNITREIAMAAHTAGYDGLVYPSYFSLLRTGGIPFETSYRISHRIVPRLAEREGSKIIPNLALFGRPIEQNIVKVRCINKVIINKVEYGIHFGPVGY